jgi:hypothetical protein
VGLKRGLSKTKQTNVTRFTDFLDGPRKFYWI